MKIHHRLIASSLAGTLSLAAFGAMAQPLAEPAALTRAEVQADLDLYRESGLAQLDNGPVATGFTAEYQAAQRRYRELRASPRYAELVRRHGGPDVDGKATATAQAPSGGATIQR